MNISIEDWYDILKKDYYTKIDPGYTCIVGPNGAGKTTMINQIKEQLRENKEYEVIYYNQLKDGGQEIVSKRIFSGNATAAATAMCSSEGQKIIISLEDFFASIGNAVRKNSSKTVVVLIDGVDSGLSIDNIRMILDAFKLIQEDTNNRIYIIVSTNAYEFAKDEDCIDPRTGEHLKFGTYEEYANYICSYYKEEQ